MEESIQWEIPKYSDNLED